MFVKTGHMRIQHQFKLPEPITVSLSKIAAKWAILATTGLALSLATASAIAAPVKTTAKYVVSLAGVNIASVAISFKDDGNNYEIDMGAKVAGVGSLVASGTAAAGSSGQSGNGSLATKDFSLETRSKDKGFNVAIQFASGNAVGFQVDPPLVNNIDRVAIERKHLRAVSDPVGAFILKGDALSPELCNRRLKVFTGIERYDIAMSFAQAQTATSKRTGYQGPVVLCKLQYIPISGHFTTSEMTTYLANSDRILIWYAPLGTTGYFIPYRVLLGTDAGDLSMVLTNLS